jgi:hypothetical protein
MIEIKQSRKLHESGFRLMQIANSSNEVEVINEAADVLHIGFKDWLDGLHLDITSKGVIRIWSNNFDLIPDKKFSGSDSIFMVVPKGDK